MELNRRRFLTASAAAPLAAATPLTALAKAPAIGTPSAGIYRTKVGDAEVTALLDGYLDVAPGLLTGYDEDTARQELSKYGHKLRESGMRIPVNGYLVNTGGKLILIDTGTAGLFGETLGNLGANLAAAGVTPDQIDTVLLTHMHVDHVGGLIDGAGKAVFPNAEIVTTQTEWDFWYSDANMAAGGEAAAGFFNAARNTTSPYKNRLRLISGETDLGSGFTSMPLPGHTPGHTGYVLSSGDETLLFWGDVIHITALQFAHPDVTIAFDTDAALTRETRARMLDMAASDHLFVTGAHIDFPGFGQVIRTGEAYRYQAAPWKYAL